MVSVWKISGCWGRKSPWGSSGYHAHFNDGENRAEEVKLAPVSCLPGLSALCLQGRRKAGEAFLGLAGDWETPHATGEASFLTQSTIGLPQNLRINSGFLLGACHGRGYDGDKGPAFSSLVFEERPNLTSWLPGFCDCPSHWSLLHLGLFGS